MKVKRFFAEDMRLALKSIRDEMGPDAVILSNRRVKGGVEVIAAPEYSEELIDQWRQSERKKKAPRKAAAKQQNKQQKQPAKPVKIVEEDIPEPLRKRVEPERVEEEAELSQSTAAAQQNGQHALFEQLLNQYQHSRPADDQVMAAMKAEIEHLRHLLKDQISHMGNERWSLRNPVQAGVVQRLEDMGISHHLADRLANHSKKALTIDAGVDRALAALTKRIPLVGRDMTDKSRVMALLGPTGVGKTTTVAKLAIRYIMRHGRDGLALVTTDCYRIAAYEQLRTLGRLIDVPVRMVDENDSLDEVLESLSHKSMILIDMAGFHSEDKKRSKQLEALNQVQAEVDRLLVLPATSQRRVLEQVYDAFAEESLAACVLTKVDEAASLGETVSLLVEKRLPLAYITTGQTVPDDLEVAQAETLIQTLYRCGKALLEQRLGLDEIPSGAALNRKPSSRTVAAPEMVAK